jgi:transposase-like protein
VARKRNSADERDEAVERLREFIRFGCMTASEVARRIGVSDGTVYSWLLGEFQPANPKRLTAFLDSLPIESSSGIAPTGYEYR